MINVVTDFGAFNNNTNSNYTPFMNAIQQAIANGGDEIYFPPGFYKIKGNLTGIKPVYKTNMSGSTILPMNIRFYGKGAKIVCDTDTDEGTVIGKGGGFALTGMNVTFEDLEFIGFDVAINTTTYGKGCLLKLTGDYTSVRNCKFRGGNGSAITVIGNYINIDANFMYTCNNYPAAGKNFGSIHIDSPSKYISISNNKIVGQFYSGISAEDASQTTDIGYLTISNNFIQSNSSSSTINRSRGIFMSNGANRNLNICNNTIEKMDAEGIRITSGAAFMAMDSVISGNIIRDCDFRGISLDSLDITGSFSNFVISNNQINNSSAAPNADHLIWMDKAKDSAISNNRCVAFEQATRSTNGIQFNNSCPRNLVVNNVVTGCMNGIVFYSPNGILAQNIVSSSTNGLQLAYGRGGSIQGNVVKSCTTGITTDVDAGVQLSGNSVLDCTNRYNTTGTVLPEVLTHTGIATDTGYSSYVVKGQLSLGSATVTFYHVYAEDKFMVIPINGTSDIQGVLYVSATNTTSSTVKVRSTLASDNREFLLVKIFSGG